MQVLKDYEEELFNKKMNGVENLVRKKSWALKNDVVEALCGMQASKARIPCGVTSDFFKTLWRRKRTWQMVC